MCVVEFIGVMRILFQKIKLRAKAENEDEKGKRVTLETPWVIRKRGR